jgi:hypothetical protein
MITLSPSMTYCFSWCDSTPDTGVTPYASATREIASVTL